MSNYWADRMAQAQAEITNKSIKQVEKKMKKYYARVAKRCIEDFEATYNKILTAVENGREPTPADLYKLDKYWEAQAQVRRELDLLADKQVRLFSKAFEENFFEVYYSIGLPSDKIFNMINSDGVKQVINQIWCADGKSWSQRIWKNTQLLKETLEEGLIHCVVTGKKTSELKKILQERFNVSYSRADALVRTELAHIQTQAAKQRYRDYGVEKIQFWADPDERTCPDCGKLHKKVYSVNDHIPLPLHPRCRCTVVPVIE